MALNKGTNLCYLTMKIQKQLVKVSFDYIYGSIKIILFD